MDIKGEERIPVPIQTVWDGLNSTEILRQAIPGCESIERIGDNELQARVMIKLGPVSARFSGKVSMSDIRPLQGYTLNFEGSGGAAGFAKGSAEIHLSDEGHETLLTYNAKASIGGKLGQLGSRLIEGSAKKLSAEFFSAFAKAVGPDAASTESVAAVGISDAIDKLPNTSMSGPFQSRLFWLAIAAAAAGLVALAANLPAK
jgi:carbon monoxide dehydrogenase subunit G